MGLENNINCTECGDILHPDQIIYLELSTDSGEYYLDKIPEGHQSQGFFPFGKSYAKKIAK